MLKQTIVGGIVGGIILFIWGFISWAVMDWHEYTINGNHEGVAAVVDGMGENLPETGVYYFPPKPSDPAMEEAWTESHKIQPHGLIFYTKETGDIMPPSMFLRGFCVDVIASMMAVVLLIMALPNLQSYWLRVMFVLSLGVFGVMSVHLVHGVFFTMPLTWTVGVGIDLVVSWLLVGLVLGGIVKP
jgi:hypothetical protein